MLSDIRRWYQGLNVSFKSLNSHASLRRLFSVRFLLLQILSLSTLRC